MKIIIKVFVKMGIAETPFSPAISLSTLRFCVHTIRVFKMVSSNLRATDLSRHSNSGHESFPAMKDHVSTKKSMCQYATKIQYSFT